MRLNIDTARVREAVISDIEGLATEVSAVYAELVLPRWGKDGLHGLPFALYGYVTGVFARIDFLAQSARGTRGDQSNGLVNFMNRYIGPTEANGIAVHMWRHPLVHTGRPRVVKDASGLDCRWLLHWSDDQLLQNQHFTIKNSSEYRILNIALLCFVDDLRRGANAYLDDLDNSDELQRNFKRMNGPS